MRWVVEVDGKSFIVKGKGGNTAINCVMRHLMRDATIREATDDDNGITLYSGYRKTFPKVRMFRVYDRLNPHFSVDVKAISAGKASAIGSHKLALPLIRTKVKRIYEDVQ